MKMRHIPVLLSIFFLTNLKAGDQPIFLSLEDYLAQISHYHPVVKQAGIVVKKAQADLLQARGGFDPVVSTSYTQKTFGDILYYNTLQTQLKIPVWTAMDIKAGIENNSGDRLSSELTAGTSSYIGLDMDVLKGLWIDKRRNSLLQAKIYRQQSEAEQTKILNDLWAEAKVVYYDWVTSYQIMLLYKQFTQNAAARISLTGTLVQFGERSLMDSIETVTQLQQFNLAETQARLYYYNACIRLSENLWAEDGSPYLIPLNYAPKPFDASTMPRGGNIQDWLARLSDHPELRIYDFKIKAQHLELKLKRQELLPSLYISGKYLSKAYYEQFKPIQQNFGVGVEFKYPLFVRQGIGATRAASLKEQELKFQQSYKKWQLENKVKAYFAELSYLSMQAEINNNLATNYQFLMRNEMMRFEQGESNVFTINAREVKLLEAKLKQLELQFKQFKTFAFLQWSAGKR